MMTQDAAYNHWKDSLREYDDGSNASQKRNPHPPRTAMLHSLNKGHAKIPCPYLAGRLPQRWHCCIPPAADANLFPSPPIAESSPQPYLPVRRYYRPVPASCTSFPLTPAHPHSHFSPAAPIWTAPPARPQGSVLCTPPKAVPWKPGSPLHPAEPPWRYPPPGTAPFSIGHES